LLQKGFKIEKERKKGEGRKGRKKGRERIPSRLPH